MRAAMGKLLAQLRRASVNGAVPEEVFVRSVRGLGLGQAEEVRLRGQLARLGLLIQNVRIHVDADSPDVEKVATRREENVSPRAGRARALLARYGDADGYVTSRALEGVIRLAGLTAREAGELRAVAQVRGAVDPGVESEGPEAAAPESRGTPEPELSQGAEDQARTRKRRGKEVKRTATTTRGVGESPAGAGETPTCVGEPSAPVDEGTSVAAEGGEAGGNIRRVAERRGGDARDSSFEVSPAVRPVPHEADWEQAKRMSARFRGGIDWLAEYALLALGAERLAVVLGPAAAVEVVHAVRGMRTPGQQVLSALEVLQLVFDMLKEVGFRPEDFFERPAGALRGLTPLAYLAGRPLVYPESRRAVRAAVRELPTGRPKNDRGVSGHRSGGGGAGARLRPRSGAPWNRY
ncbi:MULTISPECIES: hypothetical protein [Streptomyces]|uniref:hypothetical protein n=1 Tax=Streptomyces TaxID=1883 RepID=UPI0012FECC56|nr:MULTISPECIES: hypothetical protein [unclassified Streptomyces]MBT1103062.1 hypothetical protein [Streptomyces sp. Tu10]WUD88249.1 hypothetical protein OG703_08860 [Streptomyces anulatus]